jgi:hypothetical protein
LDVGDVIVALAAPHSILRGLCSTGTPDDQPHPRTNTGIAIAANGGPGQRADSRTDYRITHSGIIRRIFPRLAADLLECIVTTIGIVGTKLLEILAGPRQSHHIWPGWHTSATNQQYGGDD